MSDEKKLRMKPLFLIPPKSMSPKDIRRAERLAGIVIAECTDAPSARFLEPPIDADIDAQGRAALALMRYVMAETTQNGTTFYGMNLIKRFVDVLMYQPHPTTVPRVKDVKK